MKKGKLVLIRHGESMGQIHSDHYQDDDTNFLSQFGVQQSVHCGKVLHSGGYKFPHVFCSSMTRARHTCLMILQSMGELDRRPDMISEQIKERGNNELDSSVEDRMVEFYHTHVSDLLMHDNVMLVSHYHAINSFLDRMRDDMGHDRLGEIWVKNATPIITNFTDGMKLTMLDMPWEKK